jgi:hypothetical protein
LVWTYSEIPISFLAMLFLWSDDLYISLEESFSTLTKGWSFVHRLMMLF